MNKEDVLQFLKNDFYIISEGNSNILTSKFFRDFRVSSNNSGSVSSKSPIKAIPTIEDYSKFIEDAEVPTFLPNGQGGKYYANRVSQKGFKAFKVAASKTDEKVLLAACKWYYKQNNTSRVMIGTWFAEDIWISCVNDIKKVLNSRNEISASKISQLEYKDDNSSNMEQG